MYVGLRRGPDRGGAALAKKRYLVTGGRDLLAQGEGHRLAGAPRSPPRPAPRACLEASAMRKRRGSAPTAWSAPRGESGLGDS